MSLPGILAVARRRSILVEHIAGLDITWSAGQSLSAAVDFNAGAVHANRRIYLACAWRRDFLATAITVEGNSADQHVTERNATANISADIWSVALPAGTSGQTVRVTRNTTTGSSVGDFHIAVFRAVPSKIAAHAFDSAQDAGATLSANINVPIGGAAIGAFMGQSDGNSVTMGGLTEVADGDIGTGRAAMGFRQYRGGKTQQLFSFTQAGGVAKVCAWLTIG